MGREEILLIKKYYISVKYYYIFIKRFELVN